jgi:prevent-host-death family protein
MKFANVRELKNKTSEILRSAEKEAVIITSKGKPRAIITPISEGDFEDYIPGNSAKSQNMLAETQAEYVAVSSKSKKRGYTNITADYKKELTTITNDLPDKEVREVLDFARFLKAKKEGFSYAQIKDSVSYVRALRAKEGKKVKSAKKFIDELVEWQKSAS